MRDLPVFKVGIKIPTPDGSADGCGCDSLRRAAKIVAGAVQYRAEFKGDFMEYERTTGKVAVFLLGTVATALLAVQAGGIRAYSLESGFPSKISTDKYEYINGRKIQL
ncbi:hypothetical protein [Mobiluncus mulieris]|uniref:hypothetical protein n=1 Tax=Mobiluncus mulieris TaxID=2052 RepID=UPI0011126431|nr:hypothetical protein [Mobiluncus mulieris]